MVDEDPDDRLVARCVAGDVQAFEPLVLRYQRPLYNVAWRLLGHPEDARDVVQGALVKAWQKLHTFDPRYRFFSWVYRIVVNEALNLRDRRPAVAPLADDLRAPGGSPDEAVRERERAAALHAALLDLSDADRQVIALRHFGELSYAEIGEALELDEKTVKSRLHEARRRLGKRLNPGDFQ
jgi:RNA polymerase sigma-70 factor (ECF subfamily)